MVSFLFPQLKLALKGRIFDDIKIQEQLHVALAKIIKHRTSVYASNNGAITSLAASR
jgi:hypothetical protein